MFVIHSHEGQAGKFSNNDLVGMHCVQTAYSVGVWLYEHETLPRTAQEE